MRYRKKLWRILEQNQGVTRDCSVLCNTYQLQLIWLNNHMPYLFITTIVIQSIEVLIYPFLPLIFKVVGVNIGVIHKIKYEIVVISMHTSYCSVVLTSTTYRYFKLINFLKIIFSHCGCYLCQHNASPCLYSKTSLCAVFKTFYWEFLIALCVLSLWEAFIILSWFVSISTSFKL